MSMSIDEFSKCMRSDLDDFVADWRSNNKTDPDGYPLEMADGNEGLFYELFMNFVGSKAGE